MNINPAIACSVLEKSSDAISQWNKELRLTFANQSFADRMGISKALITGKTVQELGQPDCLAAPWTEKLKTVFEIGQAIEHDFFFATPSGKCCFHASLIPELSAEGTVASVVAVSRLASHPEALAPALEERRKLLQRIIDSSLYQVQAFRAIRNKAGQIVDFTWIMVNEKWKELYGDDMVGKSLLEENPGIIAEGLFEKFVQVTETGIRIDHEQFYDHEQFNSWFHHTLVKMGDGFVMHTQDITNRKEAELILRQNKELLRATMDSSIDMIQVFESIRDDSGKITDFRWIVNNHASEKIYGDVIGKKLLEHNPGVVQEGIFDKFKEVAETGIPQQYERHYVHEQFDGWFHQSVVKLGDGVATTTTDITERKKAEQEILQLKDEIAQKATDKYQALSNTMDEGLSVIEMIYGNNGKPVDLRLLEVNPAYEKITGLKNVAGKLGSEIVPSEQYWLDAYDSVVKTGKSLRYENYHAGARQWYRTHTSRIGGPGSHVIANLFEDITERKQRELHQDFLFKFFDSLRAETDADALVNCALQMLRGHLKLDRCHVGVYRHAEDWCDFPYQVGNDRVPPMPKEGLPLSGFPEAMRIASAKTLVISDFQNAEVLTKTDRRNFKVLGFGASVIATVRKGEKHSLWSIAAVSATPRRWSRNEIALVEEVAERTWAALERAKSVEALAKSEEKYRTLFDSMDEGYCIIQMLYDDAGKPIDFLYLQVNQAFERNNGLHNAAGKTIRELAPDIEPKWMEIYDQVTKTGVPLRFEESSEALQRIFSLYAFRIGDPADHKVAVIFTDITERKKSQEALRQSEEQFRLFVTTSSDIIYKMNADWSRMDRLTGNNLLPDTQEPNNDWVDVYIPTEDRALVKAAIEEAIRTKNIFRLEHRVNKTNGTVGWVSSRAIPVIDAQGYIKEWFGTASDISLRKQAEQQLHHLNVTLEQQVAQRTHELQESKRLLQTVFDSTQIQISILKALRDEQGNIIDFRIELVNKELERETSRNDLVGKLYAAEYPGIKTAGLFDVMLQVMETGQPKGLEYFYPHDGFNKWYSCTFVRLHDGLVATNLDITERKYAELENLDIKLKQQKELLIAILEAQEEERRRISESLHNGIAQILYAAKLNLDRLSQKVPAEYTQKIHRFLKEAIEETRRVSHELVPIVLKDFGLERAIVEMCRQLQGGQLQLECEVENIGTKLELYQELALYRISQELINNIIKHAKATEAKLLLYQEEGLIHLKVRDNGIGMKGRPAKQNGIGLRSIEDRIELLNGSFHISTPASGSGTQVEVAIPI